MNQGAWLFYLLPLSISRHLTALNSSTKNSSLTFLWYCACFHLRRGLKDYPYLFLKCLCTTDNKKNEALLFYLPMYELTRHQLALSIGQWEDESNFKICLYIFLSLYSTITWKASLYKTKYCLYNCKFTSDVLTCKKLENKSGREKENIYF